MWRQNDILFFLGTICLDVVDYSYPRSLLDQIGREIRVKILMLLWSCDIKLKRVIYLL